MKLPGYAWRAIYRAKNRWWDARAILAGYCNDRATKTGIPGEGGQWIHWRCALRRGHDGAHRARNYVWDQDGKTLFLPVDNCPAQPWDRHLAHTMRQARLVKRWHGDQSAAVRARLQREGLL
ncbi:hypothetical protein ACFXB3_07195 [Streptomyces sp. NPDC059447]|uniref:hypothetical protein n=1 Tax=Streptomyces sp. NPDC059447 TaxID=3346834 RepID=UPI0036818F8E